MPRIRHVIAVASALVLAAGAAPAFAQTAHISAYGACLSDSSYVIWHVSDPAPAHPEWVGFDVLRRVLPGCDAYVRVNEQIIPRQPGPAYQSFYREPAPGAAVEYRVIPVDASRQELFFSGGFCGPCNAYASCPANVAPITVGILQETAPGFVYVIPCPGSCYPSPYFANGVPPELAPYVGTNATFRFFGRVDCGSVEGCTLDADAWDAGTCVTPTHSRSWGRLKTIYR